MSNLWQNVFKDKVKIAFPSLINHINSKITILAMIFVYLLCYFSSMYNLIALFMSIIEHEMV
jgi:hypothetical protein